MLDKRTLDQIAREYRDGASITSLAKVYGTHRGKMKKLMISHGIALRKRCPRTVSGRRGKSM